MGCVRALLEVGSDVGETAPGAAPGVPEVFIALEVLGTELMHIDSPVRDGAPLLDWRVGGVGGVSKDTAAAADGDIIARRWLLPGTTCAFWGFFALCNVGFFDSIEFAIHFQ